MIRACKRSFLFVGLFALTLGPCFWLNPSLTYANCEEETIKTSGSESEDFWSDLRVKIKSQLARLNSRINKIEGEWKQISARVLDELGDEREEIELEIKRLNAEVNKNLQVLKNASQQNYQIAKRNAEEAIENLELKINEVIKKFNERQTHERSHEHELSQEEREQSWI